MVVISDPAFYAVAVPAVLLTGISKSGFGGGFGALAVPLMALTVPVPQAAAIMLPLLCLMDAMGVRVLWQQADKALLRHLLPGGLLGLLLGLALFKVLAPAVVAGVVGVLTLVFLAIRLWRPPRADDPALPRPLGVALAGVSGFTSFVAHAGGPPVGFYLLPMRLPPVVFTATLAVFFAVINLSKWPMYGALGLIDLTNLATAAVLAPVTPLGVWLGLRLGRWVSPRVFYRVFEAGLLLTGLKLVWDALR